MTTGGGDGAIDVSSPGVWEAGSGDLPASWDLEADVVVIGAGATGLPAAIAAIDAGASVLVVEANYDIGGHAILSGGNIPLGGGTSAQRKYGIEDSPDLVFADLTDWSIVQPNGWPDYRYNDRAIMRAFADHCAATYEFLVANGVTFKEVPRTMSVRTARATRRHVRIMRSGPTAPGLASPSGSAGAGLVRPLEASARAKGVRFLLNHKMTSLIRAASSGANPGRVVGITAQYTPRTLPGATTAVTELPLRRQHGQYQAERRHPRRQSGDCGHRWQHQQRQLPAHVRSPLDRGLSDSRRALYVPGRQW